MYSGVFSRVFPHRYSQDGSKAAGEGLVKGVAWIYTDKCKADLIISRLVFSECFVVPLPRKLCPDARHFSPVSEDKYLQACVRSETTINTHTAVLVQSRR